MSKTLTARYIDTCLPDYLQDHYNRPGQCLVASCLGLSLGNTVIGMFDEADSLPSWFDLADAKGPITEALNGVDLRYIDEHGNRCDVAPDEGRDEEPMVYVLLEWDAQVVKMRMTVDVEYMANGVDPYDLKLMLEDTIRQAAANGALTGSTEAEVTTWGATALDVTGDPEIEEPDARLRTVS